MHNRDWKGFWYYVGEMKDIERALNASSCGKLNQQRAKWFKPI
jgi:hypothetical protein